MPFSQTPDIGNRSGTLRRTDVNDERETRDNLSADALWLWEECFTQAQIFQNDCHKRSRPVP